MTVCLSIRLLQKDAAPALLFLREQLLPNFYFLTFIIGITTVAAHRIEHAYSPLGAPKLNRSAHLALVQSGGLL